MLPATTVEQEQTREIAREARNIVRLLRFESLILDREQQDTARSAQLPSRIYKRKEGRKSANKIYSEVTLYLLSAVVGSYNPAAPLSPRFSNGQED